MSSEYRPRAGGDNVNEEKSRMKVGYDTRNKEGMSAHLVVLSVRVWRGCGGL